MDNSQHDLMLLRCLELYGKLRWAPKILLVRLSLPLLGRMKVNTNDNSLGQPGVASYELIFSNARGFFHCAFSRELGINFALEAELVGAMIAIIVAYLKGWHMF